MEDDFADTTSSYSIKKPKTSRYPSLKGTDPKFRRNHRHALHGTAKAIVRMKFALLLQFLRSFGPDFADDLTEGVQGRQEGVGMRCLWRR